MERERKAWESEARREIALTDSGKQLTEFK